MRPTGATVRRGSGLLDKMRYPLSLTIALSPEFERQLREEASRKGQDTAAFARTVLEEQLAGARRERAHRLATLMEQWNAEDAADPDMA